MYSYSTTSRPFTWGEQPKNNAVAPLGGKRWRNAPRLPAYLAALERGEGPAREVERLTAELKIRERVMLGLRLDEPLALGALEGALDPEGVERLERLGLAVREADGGRETLMDLL